MFSLSHIAVVAIVVAFVVLAWKIERRPKPPAQKGPAPISIQRQIFKLGVLVVLFAGALSREFSDDETVRYIHMACTTGLAGLAYLWMFPKGLK